MRLDKQISKEGEKKEEEKKEGKTDKEAKEELNERLAGTSRSGENGMEKEESKDKRREGKEREAKDDMEGSSANKTEVNLENNVGVGDHTNSNNKVEELASNKPSEELNNKISNDDQQNMETVDEKEDAAEENGIKTNQPEIPKSNDDQPKQSDILSKEQMEEDWTLREQQLQEEITLRELDLGRVDSKMCMANLETIREGEVLEIPPDTCISSPLSRDSMARFYFGDSTSEYDQPGPTHYDDDDDAGSITSLPAELPPPPDGGWGWMIVVVSFLCNAIVDGVAYSFSPFLRIISEQFDAPQGKVAWIPSLLAGVYLSAGPIVSALVNKYGCRPVCIVGAVIASFAYFLTIFANSVEYLMIFQGVIGGFGFGLVYLPAVVCVGYYFESKRALATGIAVCGSGIGTMIFPPLLNYLISVYSWQGTNLLIAGLILNCCLFGALMRPLEVPRMKKKDLLQRLAEEKRAAMEVGSLCDSTYLTYTHADGTVEKRPRKGMNPDPGVHSHLNLSGYLTPTATTLALPTIQETQGTTPPDQESPIAAAAAISTTDHADSHNNHAHINNTRNHQIENGDDERQSLVSATDGSGVGVVVVSPKPARVAALTNSSKIPRNCSQPVMGGSAGVMPKNGSVPNFERRFSKVEVVSTMKVIPATPKASSTNLRSLGSQEMRRMSGGYGRVNSSGSFADPEGHHLHRRRSSSRSMMLRPMSRQDIFYSGSIANLREYKSQASMLSYRESSLNLQGTGASRVVLDALDGPEEQDESCRCMPESMRGTIGQMMDFSLLKNPTFLLIGVANLLGMLGFYTPFVYLPAAAMEKGIDAQSATYLISLIGITNTIGRVLSGILADLPWVNPLWLNNLCIVLSGVCVFFTPFASSYASYVTLSLFFGFFVSPFIALTSIIIVDLLSLRQLTNAFGLLCIFRGVAGILGPPVSGSIYDATKSYDMSFYSAGILLFICAALHCCVPLTQRFCKQANMPVTYTTNEEYLASVPEEEESEAGLSPDAREGAGIILDIKPKLSTIIHQDSGENKIILDCTQNEKGKLKDENFSSL